MKHINKYRAKNDIQKEGLTTARTPNNQTERKQNTTTHERKTEQTTYTGKKTDRKDENTKEEQHTEQYKTEK